MILASKYLNEEVKNYNANEFKNKSILSRILCVVNTHHDLLYVSKC